MAKDYAKRVTKRSRANQKPPSKWRVVIIISLVFVVVGTSVGGTIFYKKNTAMLTNIVALAHHKKPAANNVQIAAAKTVSQAPPAVHFDFYDALPKMQMPAPDTIATAQAPPAPRPATAKPTIFNPADVSNLLASEKPLQTPVIGQHYHLQLGVFDTDSAARLLVDAVNSIGFQARVVKFHHAGHNMYHVQQGPFTNMDLARASQLRLQKRGIVSTIKKG